MDARGVAWSISPTEYWSSGYEWSVRLKEQCRLLGYVRTWEEVEQLLRENGFEIIGCRYEALPDVFEVPISPLP